MKKIYFFSLYLAVNLILALLLLEIIFRVIPRYKLRYNLCQYALRDNPMNVAMNREASRCIYKPSDVLGYEIIPSSAPKINSFGMIGRERKFNKGQSVFRILVLGDSITEQNWYVEKLEDKLNNYRRRLKYNFELWNGAVMGYQIDQYAAYLKHKGLKCNPDMVLIGFCLNDLYTNYLVFYKDKNGYTIFHNPARALTKRIRLNNFLFKQSYFYRFLILKAESSITHAKEKLPNPKEEGPYYLKLIKDICKDKEIPLLAVIFPYLKRNSEYADHEKSAYEEIIGILKALKIDYIDLHKDFPENERYKLRSRVDDYIHPSVEGHEVAADAIYKYLAESYFPALHDSQLVKIKEPGHIVSPK